MMGVQILHCFDFALFWSGMMDYVTTISRREIVTTMIMILQSIHFGASAFLMNVCGGVVYQMFGELKMFFRTFGKNLPEKKVFGPLSKDQSLNFARLENS